MADRGIPRNIQRGKPLLDMCIDRPDILSYNEYGEDDKRIFCYGFNNKMTDEPLEECRNCGAWVYNAEPPRGD